MADRAENRRLIEIANNLFNHLPEILHTEPANAEERLAQRLQRLRFVRRPVVRDDGNCVPRAISHQLFRTEDHHRYVRRTVAAQLRVHWIRYRGERSAADYWEYCDSMLTRGVNVDHDFIRAAADVFLVRVDEVVSNAGYETSMILPWFRRYKKVIYLCTVEGGIFDHCDSMFPAGMEQERPPLLPEARFIHMSRTGQFTRQDLGRSKRTKLVYR